MDILTKIGIALAIGFIGGKLAKLVKLPSVSGYLIAGLFLGPSFSFGILNGEELSSLDFISEIALAFIAFSIGSEFVIKDMVKYGKKVFIITLLEVIGAVTVVFTVMLFVFKQDFAFSAVIASMSAATAPAATLLVVKQYRANGPMTKTLLQVVALDDVFGIIAFGIAMSLAKTSVRGTDVSLGAMILSPLIEILGSLLLGFVIGIGISLVAKKNHSRDDLQVVSLVAIIIGVGVSSLLNLSPLLTNIVIGTTIVNILPRPKKVFDSVNDFVTPFYVLFFTFAGAKLDFRILMSVGLIGIVYIFCRGLGKMFGAVLGGVFSKADKATTKYLGLGLLPQGGISIGLSVLVTNQLPEYAAVITTIIMFSVLVYETTGPIFSKLAIFLAKENHDQEITNKNESPQMELSMQAE